MQLFPKDFLWGAATSSFQIEGAFNEDGKSLSNWDMFCRVPGAVNNGDTGDVACDHYHRWKEDVAIMKKLGLKTYRFSISWPRVLPDGIGAVNKKGIEFYDRLIDALIEAGIEPMITLFHWDMPQSMQDMGGWLNPEVVDAFENYAKVCFKKFGKKVKKWATFNEAWVFTIMAYTGNHQPPIGLNSHTLLGLKASHGVNLAHAKAVRAYREMGFKGEIGIVQVTASVEPLDAKNPPVEKMKTLDGIMNRWFLDPFYKGAYPEDILKYYAQQYGAKFTPDKKEVKFIGEMGSDFIGVNYYFPFRVRENGKNKPFTWHGCVGAPDGAKRSHMGWEIYPEGIYNIIMKFKREYDNPVLYITENGNAFEDKKIVKGVVIDDDRIDYVKNHLLQIRRAINDGARVKGYYQWSLMDNFEWTHGYSKRFGIVRVDYKTLKRTIKKSGRWYAGVIKDNGV